MKYLIFGGNGFVGRYLANKLIERDKDVLVLDILPELDKRIDNKCSFISLDIRDKAKLESLDIQKDDILINLAANQYHTKVPRDRYNFFFETNTTATKNILEVALLKGCMNYIMFTTDMTYGKPQYLPVDTLHPQNPFGPYGQSKKVCEKFVENIGRKE